MTRGVPSRPSAATWIGHWRIMRVDHWIKNGFVIPGILVGLTVVPHRATLALVPVILTGLVAIGLVASSNYVLNEVLDAPYDGVHPVKRFRPVPSGAVNRWLAIGQWLGLAAGGLLLAATVSPPFVVTLLVLWGLGTLYNLEPFRTKDIPYVDVLTEALTNPVRLLAGWTLVGLPVTRMPVSLLIGYWMLGCFFMAIKRFAELRHLGPEMPLEQYRRVFRFYSEPRLLASIVFYASAAMLFLGAFIMRYRLELVLAFPFVAAVMGVYVTLAFQPDSAAQAPEKLYREPLLLAAVLLCSGVTVALLFIDIPVLYGIFRPTLPLPR